jgi:hypothetical protein
MIGEAIVIEVGLSLQNVHTSMKALYLPLHLVPCCLQMLSGCGGMYSYNRALATP